MEKSNRMGTQPVYNMRGHTLTRIPRKPSRARDAGPPSWNLHAGRFLKPLPLFLSIFSLAAPTLLPHLSFSRLFGLRWRCKIRCRGSRRWICRTCPWGSSRNTSSSSGPASSARPTPPSMYVVSLSSTPSSRTHRRGLDENTVNYFLFWLLACVCIGVTISKGVF